LAEGKTELEAVETMRTWQHSGNRLARIEFPINEEQ
jgi:hypothetical protein